jgi:hypothetical protein
VPLMQMSNGLTAPGLVGFSGEKTNREGATKAGTCAECPRAVATKNNPPSWSAQQCRSLGSLHGLGVCEIPTLVSRRYNNVTRAVFHLLRWHFAGVCGGRHVSVRHHIRFFFRISPVLPAPWASSHRDNVILAAVRFARQGVEVVFVDADRMANGWSVAAAVLGV